MTSHTTEKRAKVPRTCPDPAKEKRGHVHEHKKKKILHITGH